MEIKNKVTMTRGEGGGGQLGKELEGANKEHEWAGTMVGILCGSRCRDRVGASNGEKVGEV